MKYEHGALVDWQWLGKTEAITVKPTLSTTNLNWNRMWEVRRPRPTAWKMARTFTNIYFLISTNLMH